MITVGTTVLTPNPSKVQWSEQDLSSEASGRNLAGEMLKDIVAKKVKLELEWGPLTPTQASTILGAFATGVYFSIKYPDARTGSVTTKTMYIGDRSSDVLTYKTAGGIEYWSGVKFSLIEK